MDISYNKILLVEDDIKLASLTSEYLKESGFNVEHIEDGDKVIDKFNQFRPSLVILDIMLPGKDGMTLCKELRNIFSGPILMLTARNEAFDQVLGLEFGADDYVIKPVEPRVLLARIKALMRRISLSPKKSEQITFGELEINLDARRVSLQEKEVIVSSHEFDLLLYLAQNPGKILSRDQLFLKLYNRPYDGFDRSIDVRISQLRKKLGDDAEEPFRIKTIWGKGYLFIASAWSNC
ncbi:response regulator transcription factor [Aliikangiella sp. G2MR2-5]|uniref:response regulator transcription factor n=1 Tax=Aliikangiella sp. G2MR2-5 TaxID=2788943 RepID=UPI0018AC7FFF|nr:response regulator transcription factor [Aliikangiella sp. G2MR2-5]